MHNNVVVLHKGVDVETIGWCRVEQLGVSLGCVTPHFPGSDISIPIHNVIMVAHKEGFLPLPPGDMRIVLRLFLQHMPDNVDTLYVVQREEFQRMGGEYYLYGLTRSSIQYLPHEALKGFVISQSKKVAYGFMKCDTHPKSR